MDDSTTPGGGGNAPVAPDNSRQWPSAEQPEQQVPLGGNAAPNPTVPPDQMGQTDQAAQPADQQVADDTQGPSQDEPADDSGQPQRVGDEAITWTASEFIAHQKSAAWYGKLALVTVLVAGIIFLMTRDPIATSAVVFCAFLFGVIAGRQPRQLEYRVDYDGVKIGAKEFDYEAFRSFSIVPEGAFSSIVFMPMKRFAPTTTIYFAPEDEPRIVGLLSGWLPMQDYQHDVLDRLMHHIRF